MGIFNRYTGDSFSNCNFCFDDNILDVVLCYRNHIRLYCVCMYSCYDNRETVLTNQLIRSGTSVGANIREAFYGHSKADFVAKLQIALKECSESEYWIELLIESGYCSDKLFLDNCIEIKKILIASINTAKKE